MGKSGREESSSSVGSKNTRSHSKTLLSQQMSTSQGGSQLPSSERRSMSKGSQDSQCKSSPVEYIEVKIKEG